uniref:Uncharacterized protein n=1 Tax=Rousettus aegyptiacus TaxID=9407 RepID=A0A7J8KBJ7_ROUAE|nr:hypothetical protein HJG63_008033 [Rousettus aegyptiacus]
MRFGCSRSGGRSKRGGAPLRGGQSLRAKERASMNEGRIQSEVPTPGNHRPEWETGPPPVPVPWPPCSVASSRTLKERRRRGAVRQGEQRVVSLASPWFLPLPDAPSFVPVTATGLRDRLYQ